MNKKRFSVFSLVTGLLVYGLLKVRSRTEKKLRFSSLGAIGIGGIEGSLAGGVNRSLKDNSDLDEKTECSSLEKSKKLDHFSRKSRIDLDLNKILQMSNNGLSPQKISDKMGVSHTTIINRLKEMNYQAPRQLFGERNEKIPLDLEEIKKLRDNGVLIKNIAKKMDVSSATISDRLKEMNYQAPRQLFGGGIEKIPLDLEKIEKLRDSGLPLKKIAKKMNVSHTTISNRLKEINHQEQRDLVVPKRTPLLLKDLKEVKKLRDSGVPIKNIAEKMGVSEDAIYDRLIKMDLMD